MRVRLLTSVKDGPTWLEPGTILDFENDSARRLLRLKAAEIVENEIIPSKIESSKNINETVEYTDKEYKKLAVNLMKIECVNNDIAFRLLEGGFTDYETIANVDPSELLNIKGIGHKTVNKIQESAADLADEI